MVHYTDNNSKNPKINNNNKEECGRKKVFTLIISTIPDTNTLTPTLFLLFRLSTVSIRTFGRTVYTNDATAQPRASHSGAMYFPNE